MQSLNKKPSPVLKERVLASLRQPAAQLAGPLALRHQITLVLPFRNMYGFQGYTILGKSKEVSFCKKHVDLLLMKVVGQILGGPKQDVRGPQMDRRLRCFGVGYSVGCAKGDEKNGKPETKKCPNIGHLKAYESVALPAELGWRIWIRFICFAQSRRVVNPFRGGSLDCKNRVFQE